MIILFHPRTVKPKNSRFPLAILSIAAVLESKESYVIVDGNLDPDEAPSIGSRRRATWNSLRCW